MCEAARGITKCWGVSRVTWGAAGTWQKQGPWGQGPALGAGAGSHGAPGDAPCPSALTHATCSPVNELTVGAPWHTLAWTVCIYVGLKFLQGGGAGKDHWEGRGAGERQRGPHRAGAGVFGDALMPPSLLLSLGSSKQGWGQREGPHPKPLLSSWAF